MRAAAVTGTGGFIGGALARHLLGEGITVYGISSSRKSLERYQGYGKFIPITADFTRYGELHTLLPEGEIDAFYHLAWQGGFGKESFRNYGSQLDNEKYAADALMAAAKAGCRKFVFAGTVNEYEMETYIHLDRFEPRYTYIYSATKQTGEAICKTLAHYSGIEFCAGRIAMAYGEGNRAETLPNVVMKDLMADTPCRLVEGKDLYDMVYIDDIARAFEAIGENGKDMKSYYVGHRNLRTFREIIEGMAEVLNPECPLLFGEYPDAPSGVDYGKIDLDALYNDTGFECKADFRESIMRTAKWIRENM